MTISVILASFWSVLKFFGKWVRDFTEYEPQRESTGLGLGLGRVCQPWRFNHTPRWVRDFTEYEPQRESTGLGLGLGLGRVRHQNQKIAAK